MLRVGLQDDGCVVEVAPYASRVAVESATFDFFVGDDVNGGVVYDPAWRYSFTCRPAVLTGLVLARFDQGQYAYAAASIGRFSYWRDHG